MKYGMQALRQNMAHPTVRDLARGVDVAKLGLEITSPNTLYDSFSSILMDPSERVVTASYKLPEIGPVHEKANFDDGSLFFMFYAAPRDQMQLTASSMLYQRGWRFYKRDGRWYRPTGWGTESVSAKRTSFDYFEPMEWKILVVENSALDFQDFEVLSS
jgi:CCR4-NOT transcription complex subunit 2